MRSLLTSREVRLVLAAATALGLLSAAGLRSLPDSVRWGLLDLREWTLEASPPAADPTFFDGLQSDLSGRRPFELVLALPGPPKVGDRVRARREISVAGEGPYCLRLWLDHPFRLETPGEDLFEATVRAGERATPAIPLERHDDPVEVLLESIEPRRGVIEVEVEVVALVERRRASWQRASTTSIQHADLWRCARAEE